MSTGFIYKALSGFYYVSDGDREIQCRAKGKFRYESSSPLVGDYVEYSEDGVVESIHARKNSFVRPAVANVDLIVFIASGAKPVTDPFLIDRVSVIAKNADCDFMLVINKTDINEADSLYEIYKDCGFRVVKTSTETLDGIDELQSLLIGRKSVFTGNSGVGKSSIINCFIPDAAIETNEISDKLGRGKHTTRHIEFYKIADDSFVADTPGFASFDVEMVDKIPAEDLQYDFVDFAPYIGMCRFSDCRHISEPGCEVRVNVNKSRHDSYVRLYDIISNHKPWD